MTPQLLNLHEIGFVKSFVISQRRERYLSMLGNPERRRKRLNRLNHRQPRTARLRGGGPLAEIASRARQRAAPDRSPASHARNYRQIQQNPRQPPHPDQLRASFGLFQRHT
jgi:hypothetical protein